MARNISGTNAKFQFSKVKLMLNKPPLPPYNENNTEAKKTDLSITTTSSSPPSSIHHLDFHTVTIIILLMLSVTYIPCMVNNVQDLLGAIHHVWNKQCMQQVMSSVTIEPANNEQIFISSSGFILDMYNPFQDQRPISVLNG